MCPVGCAYEKAKYAFYVAMHETQWLTQDLKMLMFNPRFEDANG